MLTSGRRSKYTHSRERNITNMADAKEHGDIVLSAILPKRRDLLVTALRSIAPDHFEDKTQRNLFRLLERYYERTTSVLTATALDDLTRRMDAAQRGLYEETYAYYAEREVAESDFHWSVEQLKELSIEKATGELLADAMEVLTEGRKDPKTGETIQGQMAARELLMNGMSSIDKTMSLQEAPEGDIRDERDDILQDYQARKQARLDGTSQGLLLGIDALDAKIGGMNNGELILNVAYSGQGKTTTCIQTAWRVATQQGKNVVYFSLENLHDQVRRKIVSRHSKLPMFELPDGINARDLRAGTLSEPMEKKFAEVVDDLTNNPAYGQLYIAQVPSGATMASIEQRLYRIQRQFNIDFVVIDYLALLSSERSRQSNREELSSIMKTAKQVAATFDNGRGVPIMSPWQVRRESFENAEKVGFYTSAALSETAEATNSSDIIISLLAQSDNDSRYCEVSMQILKNRDGESANSIPVDVDYATSTLRSKTSPGSFGPAMTSPSPVSSPLDSLLN